MSRKDYELIAGALYEVRLALDEHSAGPAELTVHWRTVNHLADKLAVSNPRFDRERFIAAALGHDRIKD